MNSFIFIFIFAVGVVQQSFTGFDYNGESNLDLEYAMNLVNMWGDKQEVTLYQVGDLVRGLFMLFFLVL